MTKINVDNLKGGWEPEVYKKLLAIKGKNRKITIEYETMSFPYIVEHWYTPDFPVELPNGHTFYIEAKGYWTSQERTKLKKTLEENPDLDIRMVFQKDNKLNKNSTTRYSDYCIKHNIKYSIGTIPKEWLTD